MVNRYAGEIHLNPVPVLRNFDFNNEGHIADINATLDDAIRLTGEITGRLQQLKNFLGTTMLANAKFHFAPGGYISIAGLTDAQLVTLHKQGLIQLYDFATEREWVKRHGHLFGLVWENGRAVEL
jgi:hypothetical protein